MTRDEAVEYAVRLARSPRLVRWPVPCEADAIQWAVVAALSALDAPDIRPEGPERARYVGTSVVRALQRKAHREGLHKPPREDVELGEIPDTRLPSPEQLTSIRERASKIRERVREVAGDKGLELALTSAMADRGDDLVSRLAEEEGVPVTTVYNRRRKLGTKLRADDALRRLWEHG